MGIAAMAAATLVSIVLLPSAVRSASQADPAASYNTKCLACHGAKAEKKFDAMLPEAEIVKFILKGKKTEKPPNMPGYAGKGINEEQAKALAGHMKSLRQ